MPPSFPRLFRLGFTAGQHARILSIFVFLVPGMLALLAVNTQRIRPDLSRIVTAGKDGWARAWSMKPELSSSSFSCLSVSGTGWLAGKAFVLGFPSATPLWINYGLSILVFGIVFIIVVSEIRLKPFSVGRMLKDIPAGLKLNGEKIFSFLTNVSLTAVLFGFVSARYDLLYSDIRIGLILYAALGALIGWDLYREEKDVLLGVLNTCARARCLHRIAKKTTARVYLYRAREGMGRLPAAYREMSEALDLYFQEGLIPEIPRRALRKAEKDLNEFDTPYYEYCRDGMALTERMLAP